MFKRWWRRLTYKPKPGEIWYFKTGDRGPFPPKRGTKNVTVLSCKDGYVNYKFNDSFLFQDEVLSLSSFKFTYFLPELR